MAFEFLGASTALQQYANGIYSTYKYVGDGLRRSVIEPGGALTTVIWDGSDYLGEV